MHDTIDWNDSLGFLFPIDALTRRLGFSYYFDMGAISRDFWTLGAVERPYERVQFGKTGAWIHWRREGRDWFRREFDRWLPLEPHRPMVHVNWHEANARANAKPEG